MADIRRARQKRVIEKVVKGGKTVKQAGIEEGYSPAYMQSGKIQKSRIWQEIMDDYFPEEDLAKIHKDLLHSKRLDHMVFTPVAADEEITELINEAGCILRKIIHGEMTKHVYFWAPDNLARDRALDKAYKLRGKYAATELKLTGRTLSELATEEERIDQRIDELKEEEARLLRDYERATKDENRARQGRKKKRTASKAGNKKGNGGQERKGEVPAVLPEPEVGGVHSDGGPSQ